MKIRGERECTKCGTRWSYYETGSIDCPACGSLHSVGIDDRTEHTDQPVSFDLTSIRNAIDDVPTDELADRARDHCHEFVRQRGFVSGGELRDLTDTYLAAAELHHVADIIARESSFALDEREELYFLSLLRDADTGTRPPADEVPPPLRAARGLAYANAISAYRRDLRTWLDERDPDLTSPERAALETLGEHVTRVRMLDGDIDPPVADRLVEVTRDLADGLRGTGNDDAISRARKQLAELE